MRERPRGAASLRWGGVLPLGGAGLVVADVVRRDGLGLAERVAPLRADPDGDPVADAPGGSRLDLAERGVTRRADADRDEVARDEARLVHDGRLAVRPADVLRAGIDRELLRPTLADQLAQCGLVAAVDVHEERGRITGVCEQLAVEDVADRAALPGGQRAGGAYRQHREGDEPEVEQVPFHLSLLGSRDRANRCAALSGADDPAVRPT